MSPELLSTPWRQTGRARFRPLILMFGLSALWIAASQAQKPADSGKPMASAARPALTVTTTRPEIQNWPRVLAASGNVAAWQEAVIGAEISGYRITEVLVEVGDQVRKGQPLVHIDSRTVEAELAQARAAVKEAEATLAEARADGDRARQSKGTAALSAQEANQYLTAEQTALARLAAAQARVRTEELRLTQTLVAAPDDGVISGLTAALGSLAQPGQELLRLIRGGRLEWRAEVPAAEMSRLAIGGTASVIAPDGTRLAGRIRQVAPTVNPETLTGLVYVDLPVAATGKPLRAGMFVQGELDLGGSTALTLPQSAVLLREGFAYVFRLEPGDTGTLAQTKVQVDRRAGDRIEITDGLDADSLVVASGVGFLADGDLVRVVDAPPPIAPPQTPNQAPAASPAEPR